MLFDDLFVIDIQKILLRTVGHIFYTVIPLANLVQEHFVILLSYFSKKGHKCIFSSNRDRLQVLDRAVLRLESDQ